MKIFWSWQSDTDGKTGRHFIRAALEAAIEVLKEQKDVEEPAEREVKNRLAVDQDRKGVSGSPDLASLILKKIEESAVFIADVTPVSTRSGNTTEAIPEKRNMNPNVAIELGYAIRALSDRKILMVLNRHYGGREFLPFDLIHKAGPIIFDLAPTASASDRDAAFADLRGKLVTALRPFVEAAIGKALVSSFQETQTRESVATFFEPGEILAKFGEEEDDCELTLDCGSAFYLRVMPRAPTVRPFPIAALGEMINRHPIPALLRGYHGLRTTNKYGAVVLEPRSAAGGDAKAITQVLKNGELWGVAPALLESHLGNRTLPLKVVEDTYREVLPRYISFLREQLHIEPPYTMEAGE